MPSCPEYEITFPPIKYNIIYADDHPLVRHGISEYINSFDGFNVVKQVDDGKQLVDIVARNIYKPDIVLLDIEMPKMNGYEAAAWIRENYPSVKIVMLTVFNSPFSMALAFEAGACAYISKDIEPLAMESLLLNVINGLPIIKRTKTPPVSQKEYNFLKWLCSDLNYKDIALKMNVSNRTVERIVEILCKKFELSNRAALVVFAVKNGIGFGQDSSSI